jgi:hypothetical protein
MGRELTLMAAQARPTRAKAAYMRGVMAWEWRVRRNPAIKQAASSATPAMMVLRRPTREATMPMGI